MIDYLIMVLHELNDDSNVVRIVFYGNDAHDVGSVLGIGILAVFVGQYQTGIGFVDLIPVKRLPAITLAVYSK